MEGKGKTSEYASAYKLKSGSVVLQKDARLRRRSIEWKSLRGDEVNKRRNLKNLSPLQESKENNSLSANQDASVFIDKTPSKGRTAGKHGANLREKLKKWKAEKELKKKLDAQEKAKKKPFVIKHLIHDDRVVGTDKKKPTGGPSQAKGNLMSALPVLSQKKPSKTEPLSAQKKNIKTDVLSSWSSQKKATKINTVASQKTSTKSTDTALKRDNVNKKATLEGRNNVPVNIVKSTRSMTKTTAEQKAKLTNTKSTYSGLKKPEPVLNKKTKPTEIRSTKRSLDLGKVSTTRGISFAPEEFTFTAPTSLNSFVFKPLSPASSADFLSTNNPDETVSSSFLSNDPGRCSTPKKEKLSSKSEVCEADKIQEARERDSSLARDDGNNADQAAQDTHASEHGRKTRSQSRKRQRSPELTNEKKKSRRSVQITDEGQMQVDVNVTSPGNNTEKINITDNPATSEEKKTECISQTEVRNVTLSGENNLVVSLGEIENEVFEAVDKHIVKLKESSPAPRRRSTRRSLMINKDTDSDLDSDGATKQRAKRKSVTVVRSNENNEMINKDTDTALESDGAKTQRAKRKSVSVQGSTENNEIINKDTDTALESDSSKTQRAKRKSVAVQGSIENNEIINKDTNTALESDGTKTRRSKRKSVSVEGSSQESNRDTGSESDGPKARRAKRNSVIAMRSNQDNNESSSGLNCVEKLSETEKSEGDDLLSRSANRKPVTGSEKDIEVKRKSSQAKRKSMAEVESKESEDNQKLEVVGQERKSGRITRKSLALQEDKRDDSEQGDVRSLGGGTPLKFSLDRRISDENDKENSKPVRATRRSVAAVEGFRIPTEALSAKRSTAKKKRRHTLHTAKSPEEWVEILQSSPMVEMSRRTPKQKSPVSRIPALDLELDLDDLHLPPKEEVMDDNDISRIINLNCSRSDPEDFEQHMEIGESCPSTQVHENNTGESEDKHDVKYFRNLMNLETSRLNQLCDQWEEVNSPELTEDVQGQIRTVIGQAQLLIDQRFKQFSGLVDNCEFKLGEKETNCTDLQGFWDMIYYQVEDVDRKFHDLQKLKDASWVKNSPQPVKKVVKKKATTKPVIKKPVKSKFAAFRASIKSAKVPEKREFDAGFFKVTSPIKTISPHCAGGSPKPKSSEPVLPQMNPCVSLQKLTVEEVPILRTPKRKSYMPVVPSPLLQDSTPQPRFTRSLLRRTPLSTDRLNQVEVTQDNSEKLEEKNCEREEETPKVRRKSVRRSIRSRKSVSFNDVTIEVPKSPDMPQSPTLDHSSASDSFSRYLQPSTSINQENESVSVIDAYFGDEDSENITSPSVDQGGKDSHSSLKKLQSRRRSTRRSVSFCSPIIEKEKSSYLRHPPTPRNSSKLDIEMTEDSDSDAPSNTDKRNFSGLNLGFTPVVRSTRSRPSLLYTPPENQMSTSTMDSSNVAIGTLISFSP